MEQALEVIHEQGAREKYKRLRLQGYNVEPDMTLADAFASGLWAASQYLYGRRSAGPIL